jgi:hypothetical protein
MGATVLTRSVVLLVCVESTLVAQGDLSRILSDRRFPDYRHNNNSRFYGKPSHTTIYT